MKTRWYLLQAVFRTPIFRLAIVLLLGGIILNATSMTQYPYLQALHYLTQGLSFIIWFWLLPFLLITTAVYTTFENLNNYSIRLETKKRYFQELMKNVLFITTIIFIAMLLFLLLVLYIFCNSKWISINPYYHNSYLLYDLFSVMRLFLMVQVVTIINVCLLKLVPKRLMLMVVGFNTFFYILLYSVSLSLPSGEIAVYNISEMSWWYGQHLSLLRYQSFGLEVICFTLYIMVLFIIPLILYCFTSRHIRGVGE